MIPKVIHYCWFGRKPLSREARKCIKSWKLYLPDYKIKEWNEDNFDVNITPYTKEAYLTKKYAFVSDYARFWIIYHYGGIYFDVDVEVIRPLDDIISKGAFMGCEIDGGDIKKREGRSLGIAVAPGLGIGADSGLKFYKNVLEFYENLNFINKDNSLNLTTVVHFTTEIFKAYGLRDKKGIQEISGILIYPVEFFCPIEVSTREMSYMTENTRTIHHYSSSWHPKSARIKKRIRKIIGKKSTEILARMVRLIRGTLNIKKNS